MTGHPVPRRARRGAALAALAAGLAFGARPVAAQFEAVAASTADCLLQSVTNGVVIGGPAGLLSFPGIPGAPAGNGEETKAYLLNTAMTCAILPRTGLRNQKLKDVLANQVKKFTSLQGLLNTHLHLGIGDMAILLGAGDLHFLSAVPGMGSAEQWMRRALLASGVNLSSIPSLVGMTDPQRLAVAGRLMARRTDMVTMIDSTGRSAAPSSAAGPAGWGAPDGASPLGTTPIGDAHDALVASGTTYSAASLSAEAASSVASADADTLERRLGAAPPSSGVSRQLRAQAEVRRALGRVATVRRQAAELRAEADEVSAVAGPDGMPVSLRRMQMLFGWGGAR